MQFRRVTPSLTALVLLGCGASEQVAIPDAGGGTAHLEIDPSFNVCPTLTQSLVIPQAIAPRLLAEVVVIATDPDGQNSAIEYTWSASSGSFTEPKQPVTRYGCVKFGQQVLHLDATDALGCQTPLNLAVTCLDH